MARLGEHELTAPAVLELQPSTRLVSSRLPGSVIGLYALFGLANFFGASEPIGMTTTSEIWAPYVTNSGYVDLVSRAGLLIRWETQYN